MVRSTSEYTLCNVLQLYSRNNDEFWLPSDMVIQNLRIGDSVQVVFLSTRNKYRNNKIIDGERLWIVITLVKYPNFAGRLDTHESEHVRLNYKDYIQFTNEHICRVMQREDIIALRNILDSIPKEKITQELLCSALAHFTTWDDRITICLDCGKRVNLFYNEKTHTKEFMCTECDTVYDFVTLQKK